LKNSAKEIREKRKRTANFSNQKKKKRNGKEKKQGALQKRTKNTAEKKLQEIKLKS